MTIANNIASDPKPRLSIIIVVFNMRREIVRTLFSLSSTYQRGICESNYELIVVDNGDVPSLEATAAGGFGGNVRYIRNDANDKSLGNAVNLGVEASRGEFLGIAVDGARMSSPGTLHLALECFSHHRNPVIGTVGFHLGHDIQSRAVLRGYNQDEEDVLLASVAWETDGYQLFAISTPGDSSRYAWFGELYESNLIFVCRSYFEILQGYDTRFDIPGGGLVNLDFWERACNGPSDRVIVLLGEATCHQFHGGITTNRPAYLTDLEIRKYLAQYEQIRGKPFLPPTGDVLLYGQARPVAARAMHNGIGQLIADAEQRIPRSM